MVRGDTLGNIRAYGDDGTDANTASSGIVFDTEGTIGTGQVPGVIKLQVAAAGSLVDALTIDSTKAVTMAGTLAVTGTAYIGDTANANATLGLTINQGSADDEILALKSSDIAHPFTSIAEADTYGCVQKISSSQGGLKLRGFREAGSTTATWIEGYSGADSSTKTTGSVGPVLINSILTDGSTGGTAVGTDGNLAVIRNNGTTRFIFDAEGSAHSDVEWTNF